MVYSGRFRTILDLGDGENYMRPDQTRNIPVSVEEGQPVTIGAAILETGQPEGEPFYIDKVGNLRKGRAKEAARILPLLKSQEKTGDLNIDVDSLVKSVSALEIREDISESVDIFIGRREVYDEVMRKLKEMSAENSTLSKEHLDKLILRLTKLSNKEDKQ